MHAFAVETRCINSALLVVGFFFTVNRKIPVLLLRAIPTPHPVAYKQPPVIHGRNSRAATRTATGRQATAVSSRPNLSQQGLRLTWY